MIKAIPTKYKGYEFKSRIEARWAVFFDSLGLKWEYEKEGYVLSDGTWYLPDFWLPDLYMRDKESKGVWVEVKGADPTKEEQLKCELFTAGINQPLLLVWGEICVAPNMDENRKGDGYYEYGLDRWDNCMCFYKCYSCGCVKVEFSEQNYEICPLCRNGADELHPSLLQAEYKARNAKF